MGDDKSGAYAGFGVRFAALIIDLFIIFFILQSPIHRIMIRSSISLLQGSILEIGFLLLVFILYDIYLTYYFGSTIGKKLLGIMVVNKKKVKLSLIDSVARHFSKWISTLTLGIGYLMILWDDKKQALHDRISNTYVIDNPKRRIGNNLRNILVLIIVTFVIIYVYYLITLLAFGFKIALDSQQESLSKVNTLNSIFAKCNSTLPFYSDICYSIYANKVEFKRLDLAVKLDFCHNIHNKNQHLNCISTIAVYERNASLCSNSRSTYLSQICKKSYNATVSLVEKYYPEKEFILNGTLNVTEIKFGLWSGSSCLELQNYEFLQEDLFCFQVNNVTGFVKDEDGLNWYDVAVKQYKNGNLIDDQIEVYGKDGQVDLKNNFLDSAGMHSRLNGTLPGTYSYQVAIYDKIGMRGNYYNKTIEVIDLPIDKLNIQGKLLGLEIGDNCIQKHTDVYTNRDAICYYPLNVSGFNATIDNLYIFTMDILFRNQSGEIFYESKGIYSDEDPRILRNGILNLFPDVGVREDLDFFHLVAMNLL
ncbi:RDD family protein [Candidatus Woesearchaeota archaeon]|nr:RDD family protein [Candidatus Woesearchaeota archaeon]